jgi:hypothetical protein
LDVNVDVAEIVSPGSKWLGSPSSQEERGCPTHLCPQ